MYKKPKKKKAANAAPRLSDAFQTESGTDTDDSDNDGSDCEEPDTEEGQDTEEEQDNEEPSEESCWEVEIPDGEDIVFLPEVEAIIKMVLEVVKVFSGSPVKNNILQGEVVRLPERKGKELRLKLDCPTRWNTIVGKKYKSRKMLIKTLF